MLSVKLLTFQKHLCFFTFAPLKGLVVITSLLVSNSELNLDRLFYLIFSCRISIKQEHVNVGAGS